MRWLQTLFRYPYMSYLPNVLFALLLIGAIGFFVRNVKKLSRNIGLGKDIDRSDRSAERFELNDAFNEW